jgi:hypothetical protein
MFVTAPSPVAPTPSQIQPAFAQQPTSVGAEASGAPRPELGTAAVTQSRATARADLGMPDLNDEVPEIPPDPPPVKGLGVPALNTAMVGDGDEVETPPPPPKASTEEYLAALQPPGPNDVDKRV